MIKIYDKSEKRFVTNGLVVLDSCKSLFITEELNGSYELEMEYPVDNRGKWQYLKQDNIIQADGQLFRIYRTDKKDFNSITVNARAIFYDLLDNLVEDIDIRGLSGAAALDKVMSSLAYSTNFTAMSDITATNSIYLDDESGDITGKNPVDAIMFLVQTYGGELVRDNFNIKFLQARGHDRGMLISYGKNIKGIEEDINIDSVVTRIKPVGQDGLTLDEVFVDSPHINEYAHPKIAVVEFSDDNDYDSLRNDAKQYFINNKCDIPQVNYKVDFVELRKTEEYKNYDVLESVYLGDTVTVRVKKLNIDVKCEVISIKKNILLDRIEEIELGNFKKNIAESLNKAAAVTDVFGGAIANGKLTKRFLQSWVDNATNLIIKSNNGHVLTDENGYNVMDTTDKATAKNVWRFDMGGLGFSSTGYNGPFGLALTNDGAIVADRITAGELNGAILKAGTIKTSALELNAQQTITTTVPNLQSNVGTLQNNVGSLQGTVNGLSADNTNNKNSIVNLQTQITALPGTIDSKVSASSTTTLNFAKSYADTVSSQAQSTAISTASTDATAKANNAQSNAVNSAKSYTDGQVATVSTVANNAQNTANAANNTANDLKNNVIPPIAVRLQNAEQKITPEVIVSTVSDSITYYKDTLLPTVTNLTTTRAGAVINPLNNYNFTGGSAIGNNTLVTMQSGANEYTPSLNGLEIYGATAVTFDRQVDRVQNAESEISQQAGQIALVVKSGAIDGNALVAAINVSSSKIQMSALNIDLSGYVTFNSLKTAGSTTINGSNITTGSINANLITAGTISGDRIYGGTIVGALLQTSNGSNYVTLQNQWIGVYNGSNLRMQLGFLNTSDSRPMIMMAGSDGTQHKFFVDGGKLYFGTSTQVQMADINYVSSYVGQQIQATTNWVLNQGYLKSSALSGYATTSYVTSSIQSAGNDIMLYIQNNCVMK